MVECYAVYTNIINIDKIWITWPASSAQGSPKHETGEQWLLATKLLLCLLPFFVQVFSSSQHFLVKRDKVVIAVFNILVTFQVFIPFALSNMTLIFYNHEVARFTQPV